MDVRIVAATNKDLAQAVQERTFRSDLYYRIHIIPPTMPPLCERRDDIPLFAQHCLTRSTQRLEKHVRRLHRRL